MYYICCILFFAVLLNEIYVKENEARNEATFNNGEYNNKHERERYQKSIKNSNLRRKLI